MKILFAYRIRIINFVGDLLPIILGSSRYSYHGSCDHVSDIHFHKQPEKYSNWSNMDM